VASGLVRCSRWLYGYMGSDGGALPWGALLAMAGSVALGSGLGFLAAQVVGGNASDWSYNGFMVALVVDMTCLLIASVVVLVAWLVKIEDDDERKARRSRR
jgi:hypothetical protein